MKCTCTYLQLKHLLRVIMMSTRELVSTTKQERYVVGRKNNSLLSFTASTNANSNFVRALLLFSLLTLLAFQSLLGAVAFFIDERQSPHTSEWNYQHQQRWSGAHRECSGKAQSPIDIKYKNVIVSQQLKLHFYNYNKQLKFKLTNAHHTIKMNPLGRAYESQANFLNSIGGGKKHGEPNSDDDDESLSSIHDIITAAAAADDRAPPLSNEADKQRQYSGKLLYGNNVNNDNTNMSRVHKLSSSSPPPSANLNKQTRSSAHHNKLNTELANNNNDDDDQQQQEEHNDVRIPYGGAPTIKLDWLDDGNNEYKLRDIHFHWGERRDNGSEHAIDGRRAAMEMHLVHIKHGLDKSKIGFTSDSVAVIAILIESHRKSNADFNPIVNELARINSTEQAQDIDYKSLYDLLPSNLHSFYTYSGSLTTPPCYEVVNWIVMAERLNMNAKQIEMFRNLYAPPHEQHHANTEQQQQHLSVHKSFDSISDSKPPPPRRHQFNDGSNDERSPSFVGRNPNFQENFDQDNTSEQQGGGEHEPTMNELIMPNVRWIQSLNNRTIMASFSKHNGAYIEHSLSGVNSINVLSQQLCIIASLSALSLIYYFQCIGTQYTFAA